MSGRRISTPFVSYELKGSVQPRGMGRNLSSYRPRVGGIFPMYCVGLLPGALLLIGSP